MAGRLAGKVAIITGAATGIGEAIAHKFAAEGARVMLAGLPGDPLDDVAGQIKNGKPNVAVFVGDLGEQAQAEACVEATLDAFGRIDVLVNNAGVFPEVNETQDFSTEAFDKLLHNNIRPVFYMTRAALPHLQKVHGNIVAAGSEAGLLGLPEVTPYGASKGWIHSFIRGVAVEQARYDVRANCVCPGAVDTAWTHRKTGPMDLEMEKTIIAATPLGRRATPEEVANVYAFLASDEASFVTGAMWTVDGGITLSKGPVGLKARKDARRQPEQHFDPRHQHDGRASKKDSPG